MKDIIERLGRNPDIARREVAAGMHHTFYWLCAVNRFLKDCGASFEYIGNDSYKSGSHTGRFKDPDTGKIYEISIKPV